MKLINTCHLVGVFIANLLTEKSLLRQEPIEGKIASKLFVITSKEKRNMFPELPMDSLTKRQPKKYKKATKCHICYNPFTLGDRKVRDHCHCIGLYRGPSHSLCNLRYKIPSYIPVVFHSLSGYDAHLFIRELGAHTSDMEVIAKNKEDYISFSIKVPVEKYIDKNAEKKDKLIELRFIDSFKSMSSSLDSLTKNLVSSRKKLFGLVV